MDYQTRGAYIEWCDDHPDMFNSTTPVSEVFGPTIQGEGTHAGRACWFIRTGGCNLSCAWCDTPYSTGQHGIPLSTVPRITADQAIRRIPENSMVVVTGGEPLMHLKTPGMQAILHGLRAKGCEVHVETNGTINPGVDEHLFDHFTVSPKLGVEMANRRHSPSLADWSELIHKTIFKWVIDGLTPDTPLNEVEERINNLIQTSIDHGCLSNNVWVMPEGTTADELAVGWPLVAQAAANLNINATHRLHTLAWGNQKGH